MNRFSNDRTSTSPNLDVLNVCSVILRSGDRILLHDPSLNVFHFAMKLKQFLRLDEFTSSRRGQLQQLAVLVLDARLLVADVGGVEVAARHEALAQRRQFLHLLVEVLHVQFDCIQLLKQRLATSATCSLV